MPSLVNKDRGMIGSNVMRKGCMVGLATVGHHSFEFTRVLLNKTIPLNYVWSYAWVVGRNLSEAYNILFDTAKQGEHEYLFFLEEDTIPKELSFFSRMINKMKYNPDIFAITAVYPRKHGGDPTPFFYRGNGRGSYLDWKWGEFFEVSAVPFGCTIFRMNMLEQIDPFVDDVEIENYPGVGQKITVKDYCKGIVPFIDEKGTANFSSQDLYFSERASEAGLHMFVDTSIDCWHIDLQTGTKYQVPQIPHEPDYKEQEGKKAIDLGCGSQEQWVHGLKPTRVDYREEVKPDLRMDLRDMSGLKSDDWDYVYSSHTLEHFTEHDAKDILKEMVRICKPGGEIHLVLPNIMVALELLQAGMHDTPAVWWQIYGNDNADWNMHKTGFTPERIGKWMSELGLKASIMLVDTNMMIRAFKPPYPDWMDDWLRIDKDGWTWAMYFSVDQWIRLNGKLVPLKDGIPHENVEAVFGKRKDDTTSDNPDDS